MVEEVTSGGTEGAGGGWPCPPGWPGALPDPTRSTTALLPSALGSWPAALAFIRAMATWASLGCSTTPPLMFNVFVMTFDEQPVEAEYEPPNPRCPDCALGPWSWMSEPLEEELWPLSMETLFMLEYCMRRSSAVNHCCMLAALSDLCRCGKKSGPERMFQRTYWESLFWAFCFLNPRDPALVPLVSESSLTNRIWRNITSLK